MRLALLSNVTLEVLAGLLKKEQELWLPAGFGAWMETALNIPETLHSFDPEAIYLLLDESHAVAPDPVDEDRARTALESAFPRAVVQKIDLVDLADEVGEFYDERMWKIASMPWSLRGLKAIVDEINRLAKLQKTAGRKVLAVDFDNTLWDGVVGEDGGSGIVPKVDFQRKIKVLKDRGVLLVGLSKNNPDDVEPVWSHPLMVLHAEDFVALRLNWRPKAENLEEVAQELNLGIDSFVFLDDNPAERAQMRAFHPDVATPDDPFSVRRLERLYFPVRRISEEDCKKTELYRAEARRTSVRALYAESDFSAYLKDLAMWRDVHPVRDEEFARVAQLSQKSNQFNVCTNRYSVADIARFATDENRLLLTVHAGDRFGDQGLVAFVQIVQRFVDEWEIVDWVMSCRTMNRRLEFAIESDVERRLLEKGAARLVATWRKTPKNAPVETLFEQFGFTVDVLAEEMKRYSLDLPRASEYLIGCLT